MDPAPKLPDPPTRRPVWPSTLIADPVCDCEGDGVCEGGHAFFEAAEERARLDDIARSKDHLGPSNSLCEIYRAERYV